MEREIFDAFSREKQVLHVVFWSYLWQNKANFFSLFHAFIFLKVSYRTVILFGPSNLILMLLFGFEISQSKRAQNTTLGGLISAWRGVQLI